MSIAIQIVLVDDDIDFFLGGLDAEDVHGFGQNLCCGWVYFEGDVAVAVAAKLVENLADVFAFFFVEHVVFH